MKDFGHEISFTCLTVQLTCLILCIFSKITIKEEWKQRNLETGTTSPFAYQVWYDLKYKFIDSASVVAVFIVFTQFSFDGEWARFC